MTEPIWDPEAEVRCIHVSECGACPLMPLGYARQRAAKLDRIALSLGRYGMAPGTAVAELRRPELLAAYRRRAKLVVARTAPDQAAIGLFRRHDSQVVIDIPGCQVLSPTLLEFVANLRPLIASPPPSLLALLTGRSSDGTGVLSGLDVRELRRALGNAPSSLLVTLTLAAEHAAPVEELRDAARALRQHFPSLVGVAVELRVGGRGASSASEFVVLSGESEVEDAVDDGGLEPTYQLVSHTSFLRVHREQASMMHRLLRELVAGPLPVAPAAAPRQTRVLDLYGGTGALSLALARAGHAMTLVESHPSSVALALRAASAQRLKVEVISGEVASVTNVLAAAGATFDVVIANPPRRGMSPAAREAVATLRAERVVYVACELDNLSRDLEHFARLGYQARVLHPLDTLPLTDEVEVVAVLHRGPSATPALLFAGEGLLGFAKPAHEPLSPRPEYPSSVVERARGEFDGGAWEPVVGDDAGISGVCLFARDAASAERWRASLERTGRLIYLAAARGVAPVKGSITRDLHGEHESLQARTRYRRLAIGGGHSVLRLVPERPVPHQVRRHLAAMGHPVLGDMRYGHAPTNRYFEEKYGLDRSFLHLVRVEVDHPDTGERLQVEAPLPADLRAALARASDESVLRFLDQKGALGIAGGRLDAREDGPQSETGPASMREFPSESARATYGLAPISVPGRSPLEFDEAPRTIRGELLRIEESDDL